MKRLFVFLIVLVLILSSCSVSETTSNGNNNVSNSEESKATVEQSTPEDTSTETSKEIVSFEEKIVIDNEQCTIKITKIEENSIWGYTLKVYLENKSSDKKYMFSAESAYVNGLEIEPMFASEVESGKKANESLVLTLSELEEKEIGTITDIELKFRVYDSDDWLTDDVANVTTNIYPFGEDKADKYVREDQTTDTVLVDNDDIKVIVTGYTDDEIWGYTANLYIENKTDKELMYTADDVSVNGFMIDPLFATTVGAGKCKFDTISWFTESFEENEIVEVTDIEFNLRVYDSNNWDAKDIFKEKVTLNP